MATETVVTSDLAFSIGCLAGWLALVLFMLWPTTHDCHDKTCRRLRDERDKGEEFK
jgi:hypothetical protein